MPQEDPAPVEGGALKFFATEFGTIVEIFAEHGHANPPLRISLAVAGALEERARLRRDLENAREELAETQAAHREALSTIATLKVERLKARGGATQAAQAVPFVLLVGQGSASDRLSDALRSEGMNVWQVHDDETVAASIMRAVEAFDVVVVFPSVTLTERTRAFLATRKIKEVHAGGRTIDSVADEVRRIADPPPRVLLIGESKAQRVAANLLSGQGPAVTRATSMEQAIDFATNRGPFRLAVMVDGAMSDQQWAHLITLIPNTVLHNDTVERIADYIRQQCAQPATTTIDSSNSPDRASGE